MCKSAPNQTYGHLICHPAEPHAKGLQTVWAAIKHGAIKGRQRWWGWTESNPLLITDDKWVLPEDLNEGEFIGGFIPSHCKDAWDKWGAGQLSDATHSGGAVKKKKKIYWNFLFFSFFNWHAHGAVCTCATAYNGLIIVLRHDGTAAEEEKKNIALCVQWTRKYTEKIH